MHSRSFRTSAILGTVLLAELLLPLSTANAQLFLGCEKPSAVAFLDVNNVKAQLANTGFFFRKSGQPGYEIPKGSGTHSIYDSALWIGGLVNGDIRISASRYANTELWSGPLDELGKPPTDCASYDRIYKISHSDIETYVKSGFATKDMEEWPTGLGAPTIDAFGNKVDVMHLPLSERKERLASLENGEGPLIRGDQILWWVMNDRGNHHDLTGSPPLGIEVHAEAFAVARGSNVFDNTTLFSYKIFNRSSEFISGMYVSLFLDPDIGNITDDYMGSDSLLGIGYVYNADNNDEGDGGYGSSPPALGAMFLEGPHVENDGLDNDEDGHVDEPGERLRTTVVGSTNASGAFFGELPLSSIHYYRYMRGFFQDGKPYTYGGNGRDFSNTRTYWLFSGDPVTGEFWSEINSGCCGSSREPGDRNILISSGPFSMNPGEETDVTLAIVWARGSNHLDSVTKLKEAAALVQSAFDQGAFNNSVSYSVNPPTYSLESAALDHNYPDPFSEQTTIRYRLPDDTDVKLVVYDMLGREVQTLVDKHQEEGLYEAIFNGRNLPSGVYFYRIHIGTATATRPMILAN